jgi:hypothetical protein
MIIVNTVIDMTKGQVIPPVLTLQAGDQILDSDIIGGEIKARECQIAYMECVINISEPARYSTKNQDKPSASIRNCRINGTKLPPFDTKPILSVNILDGKVTHLREDEGEL